MKFILTLLLLLSYNLLNAQCTLVCENGGILDFINCQCICDIELCQNGGVTTEDCSCDCPLICENGILNVENCTCDCPLICENGGALDVENCQCICDVQLCENGGVITENCTCDCPLPYSGDNCEIFCGYGRYIGPDNVCTECSEGFYQDELGQVECKECPLGTYGDEKGLKVCKPCQEGEYQDVTGNVTCKVCPEGYISPKGSTSLSDCVLIKPIGSVEITGRLTVESMLKSNDSDELIIRRPDGYLGYRELSSITDDDGWIMIGDTLITDKNVNLSNKLTLNHQNYAEAATFGMTMSSRDSIIANSGGFINLKYIFGDTTLFEPIRNGDFGVRIKKQGVLWITAQLLLKTTGEGYSSLQVYKNDVFINGSQINASYDQYVDMDCSFPILVSANDIIKIKVFSSNVSINTISLEDQYVNFNFLWFSR